MQEQTPYKLERSTIVQISVAIAAAFIVLLVFNYQNVYSYQDMAQDVSNDLINEPDVDAVLMTYRDTEQAIELKVTLIGLTQALPSYESDALNFVCKHPILREQLREEYPVEITLVATRTKKDKYLTLLVTASSCDGLVP
jgi:hypothetical protein